LKLFQFKLKAFAYMFSFYYLLQAIQYLLYIQLYSTYYTAIQYLLYIQLYSTYYTVHVVFDKEELSKQCVFLE